LSKITTTVIVYFTIQWDRKVECSAMNKYKVFFAYLFLHVFGEVELLNLFSWRLKENYIPGSLDQHGKEEIFIVP